MMSWKKVAISGFVLILPISIAMAQSGRINLGYVDNDGIVVRYQGGFQNAVTAAQKESRKALSSWQNCMTGNQLSKAFELSPQDYQRYRVYPAAYCGPQPDDRSAQAGQFSLKELRWSPTGTQIGRTLSTFTFTNPGEMRVPLNETISGKCVAFFNANGNPIAVRTAKRDDNAFAFTNPFAPLNGELRSQEAEVARLRSALQKANSDLAKKTESANAQLVIFRSLGNSSARPVDGFERLDLQCTAPAQRPIPPRPTNIMSARDVEYNANGSCWDLLARRHDRNMVANAIVAYDRDDRIRTDFTQWSSSRNKASCSLSYTHSDFEDQMIRGACSVGAAFFSDVYCYQAIRQRFDQCRVAVRQSCGGEEAAYEQRVAEIRREPGEALRQCNTMRGNVMRAWVEADTLQDQTIPQLETQYAEANRRLVELRSQPQEAPQSMSLAEARCGG